MEINSRPVHFAGCTTNPREGRMKQIDPGEEVGRTAGEIACRERLGGILRYYHREAA